MKSTGAKQQKQRSCLYDLGWIRQKSDWLNALKQFAGQSWIDVSTLNMALREQINNGTAFQKEDGSLAESKESAKVIRLRTGVYSNPQVAGGGDQAREVIIEFHRNRYDVWVGLDFDFGDVVSEDGSDVHSPIAPLYRDVYFDGRLQSVLPKLADIAVDEMWQNDEGETGLLVPYLKHTYERLEEEKKCLVSNDGKLMVFNTGLVSRKSFDPIVVLCEKNDTPNQRWKFKEFLIWASHGGAETMRKFDGFPPPIERFSNMDNVVLRPTAIKRMPGGDIDFTTIRETFKRSMSLLLSRIAELRCEEGAITEVGLQKVKQKIQQLGTMWKNRGQDPEEENSHEIRTLLYMEILNNLGGRDTVIDVAVGMVRKSLDLSLKLLSWEINAGVPMYVTSKRDFVFSFMLPLNFACRNPEDADVAIVLEPAKTANGLVYTPKALLELKYAYSNARLLSRPVAPWLIKGYCQYLKTMQSERKDI